MTRLIAPPHLQTMAVQPRPWLMTLRGETSPVPELLRGWDYSTPLKFECELFVDLEAVRTECGLAEDAKVSGVGLYSSSSTNRRDVGAIAAVKSSGTVALAFDVPTGRVGGRLTLRRQLILADPGSTFAPFAAKRGGAVLWDEERKSRTAVTLEGEAA